ncbi:MAG: hypothetical protein P1P64_03250 [Treponemataceae bacterium]
MSKRQNGNKCEMMVALVGIADSDTATIIYMLQKIFEYVYQIQKKDKDDNVIEIEEEGSSMCIGFTSLYDACDEKPENLDKEERYDRYKEAFNKLLKERKCHFIFCDSPTKGKTCDFVYSKLKEANTGLVVKRTMIENNTDCNSEKAAINFIDAYKLLVRSGLDQYIREEIIQILKRENGE